MFVVLHVFLVPIISSHDKLWGLARRVFTLLWPKPIKRHRTPFQILRMGRADDLPWSIFCVFFLLLSSSPVFPSNISTTVEYIFEGKHEHLWQFHSITSPNVNATSSSRNESETVDPEELPFLEHSATFQVNFAAKAASMMATVTPEADSYNTTRHYTNCYI